MKKLLLAISSTALLSFSFSTFADNLKIGVIDMNKILQKSPMMISINDGLNKKFSGRQVELNKENIALQDEVNKINTTTMSQDERNKLQDKIIADKAAVAIMAASLQRDLDIAKTKEIQAFSTRLNSVISKIANEGHYDLIQQASNLNYVNSKLDITQQIIDQMN